MHSLIPANCVMRTNKLQKNLKLWSMRCCFDKFSKPLLKVQCVLLLGCDLGDKLFPKLSALFLNLNQLEISYSLLLNPIMTHFPDLKKLTLLHIKSNRVQLAKFESFLNLNQQLSSCVYHEDLTDDNNWGLIGWIDRWKKSY